MAKRYIFEDGYFAALNKPHVRGVYGRLAGLTPDGVKLDDGTEIEADYVVLSTGYDAGVSTWCMALLVPLSRRMALQLPFLANMY